MSVSHGDAYLIRRPLSKLVLFLKSYSWQSADEVRLWFYNLSRSSSAELLDQALPAFLEHEGWKRCFEGEDGQRPAYGAHSPIRRNYELLSGTRL